MELNAVNDLYFADFLNSTRLNMNLLLRISNAKTTKMMTDIACDFIEPSEEDTLEYEKQHQFKLDTSSV
jgi:hypothetical protein